jgi:hypothetical protein
MKKAGKNLEEKSHSEENIKTMGLANYVKIINSTIRCAKRQRSEFVTAKESKCYSQKRYYVQTIIAQEEDKKAK